MITFQLKDRDFLISKILNTVPHISSLSKIFNYSLFEMRIFDEKRYFSISQNQFYAPCSQVPQRYIE